MGGVNLELVLKIVYHYDQFGAEREVREERRQRLVENMSLLLRGVKPGGNEILKPGALPPLLHVSHCQFGLPCQGERQSKIELSRKPIMLYGLLPF